MSEKEAEYLLNVLKEIYENEIVLPLAGEKTELIATDINEVKNKFLIIVRKGKKNPEECTFHAMLKDSKENLLRLDVCPNENAHKNPDGSIIYGTHMHVYKEGLELAYAVKFDIHDPNLIQYCKAFLDKMNVINLDKKTFCEGMTLFN